LGLLALLADGYIGSGCDVMQVPSPERGVERGEGVCALLGVAPGVCARPSWGGSGKQAAGSLDVVGGR
jgi:hypothetical protein